MAQFKIKEVVRYNGHKVKANGTVDLGFKAMYSEITNSMSLLQLLNNDVRIKVKLPGSKPMDIGMFRIAKVIFDDDGESILNFTTLSDYVEMDNLNRLVGAEEFQMLMESNVELEDDESEE